VILDQFTAAYVAGTTTSVDFPTTKGVFQPNCGTDTNCNGGLSDAFAFKVSTSAKLTVTMTAPSTVKSGATLTYTITGGNTGPDDASVVALTDTLPTGTTFKSVKTSNGTCTAPAIGGTGTVVCTAGLQTVATNVTETLVVTVTAASGTVIMNSVNDNAPNSSNNPTAMASTTVN
jgi:uncharacterized repeat protein (TIGR01451 family)